MSPLLIKHNNRKILASISANFLYGIDAENGNWCSVDWETGTLMYETHWENKGAAIMAYDIGS